MCYTIPLIASVIATAKWRKKKTARLWWLVLMLYGASAFGVIDHLYNGELLLVSDEWQKDILLGFLITAGVIGFWAGLLAIAKRTPSIGRYLLEQ